MKPHWFNIAALVSTAFATVIIFSWMLAGSGHIDGQTPLLSLSKNCHLTIYGHDADDRLAVFNDAQYGPYHGSIVGLASRDGRQSTVIEHGFGDTAGIYYRYFRWPGGAVLWTLMISLAWPLGISLVLPFVWFFANFKLRRPRNNL